MTEPRSSESTDDARFQQRLDALLRQETDLRGRLARTRADRDALRTETAALREARARSERALAQAVADLARLRRSRWYRAASAYWRLRSAALPAVRSSVSRVRLRAGGTRSG